MTDLSRIKHELALPLEELRRLDSELVRRWSIDFLDTQLDLTELVSDRLQGDVRESLLEAIRLDGVALRNGGSEMAIYDAMCAPAALGLVTSSRRAFLLDAVSLAAALVGKLGIQGRILDVGCHAGVATHLLNKCVPNEIWGLDPSRKAIEVAKASASGAHGLTFVEGGMPWNSPEEFDLILSVDSLPKAPLRRTPFLKSLAGHLSEAGIAVIVSQHWVDMRFEELRRQLAALDLGFCFADVVGGYGGLPTGFSVEGCLVLMKGGKRQVPRDFANQMQSNWPQFRSYANSPGASTREKTQAFHRAHAS